MTRRKSTGRTSAKKRYRGTASADGKRPYAVGYGRPPVATRFQPGQSGNAKGRKRHSKNLATFVDDILKEKITIQEAGTTKRISKAEALARTVVTRAFKGEPKALAILFSLTKAADTANGGVPPEAGTLADYQAIIDHFLARQAPKVSGGETDDSADEGGRP